VNALANDEVGKYFKTHFVASYQKVGNFRIDGDQKQGGNVASYFCTSDGRVIHVIAGPVNAKGLLKEARWAVETWKLAQLATNEGPKLQAFFRNAHAVRLWKEHGLDLRKPAQSSWSASGNPVPPIYEQARFKALSQTGRVHLLLSAAPLIPIANVYRVVFEKVLDEPVSVRPVEMAGSP
jgi:hypothetical protein